MSRINDVCDWFEANVEKADPWAVVLKLGMLNLLDAFSEDKQRIKQTLKQFQATYPADKYLALWKALIQYNQENPIIDFEILQLMQSAQFFLLTIPNAFNALSDEEIVAIGKDYTLYRIAMLALIRKHNLTNDLFNNLNFMLLKEAGAEQTSSYLGAIIKLLERIPVFALEALGQQPYIAELILKDCYSHDQYFELSASFAKKFPTLRASIAQNWSHYFQHYPLTTRQVTYLESAISEIRQLPEFANVDMASRLARVYVRAKPEPDFLTTLFYRAKWLFSNLVEENLTVSQECIDVMHRAKSLIVGYSNKMVLEGSEELSLKAKLTEPKLL